MISIPTILTLRNDIRNNLKTELGITQSFFGKVFLEALALVFAAKFYSYYLHLQLVQRNQWVDTADNETLDRFGFVKIGRTRNPATQAVIEVTIDNVSQVNGTVLAQTIFVANSDSKSPGARYILETTVVVPAGNDLDVDLRSLSAGTEFLLNSGDRLTSVSPLLNIQDEVIMGAVITTPVDQEPLEDFRDATERAFQLEPQGGSASDYRIWSSDANGVRTVYPYATTATANSVDIFVEANTGDGTANAALLLAVDAVLEQDPDTTKPLDERGRRPIGILNLFTISVTTIPVVVTITALNDTSASVQTAITTSLEDDLRNVRPFIPAADILENKNDTLQIGIISQSVQQALTAGNAYTSIEFTVNAITVTSFQFVDGNIPNLTNVVFN